MKKKTIERWMITFVFFLRIYFNGTEVTWFKKFPAIRLLEEKQRDNSIKLKVFILNEAALDLFLDTKSSAQSLYMKLFVVHYKPNDKCTSRGHIKSLDPVPLPCVSIKTRAIPL